MWVHGMDSAAPRPQPCKASTHSHFDFASPRTPNPTHLAKRIAAAVSLTHTALLTRTLSGRHLSGMYLLLSSTAAT